MSGQEIRALENDIKKLKIENSQKDKQNQALQVLHEEIQSQLGAQKIENYSVQQERDGIRLQLDQMN